MYCIHISIYTIVSHMGFVIHIKQKFYTDEE